MSDGSDWTATGGWSGWITPGSSKIDLPLAGVRIRPLARTPLATLVAATGATDALSRFVAARFGLDLPATGRCTRGDGTALVWSAPRQWLLVGHRGTAQDLAEALAGTAAVTDQTDGRALVVVDGPHARDTLAEGFAIDLHPRAFPPGSCAATKVAHVAVQIWLGDDGAFTIAVPRSFTQGVWSWLCTASRRHG